MTKSKSEMQCNNICCGRVCQSQSPGGPTGCKTLSQVYLLGKVHIPKVPGSQRTLFSHTPYFIIIVDLWGVHVSSHGLLSCCSGVLQTWQPSQLCIQSLLFNLEPWVKSWGLSTARCTFKAERLLTGVFKVRAAPESLTGISTASLSREHKHLSSQICSSVNDKGQRCSKMHTDWPERSQQCKAVTRVSNTNEWSIILILCDECFPIGGATALHFR